MRLAAYPNPRSIVLKWAWAALVLAPVAAGRAQAAPEAGLLPPDPARAAYVAQALAGNLALQQRRLSVEEARAVLAQARAQFFPSVGLEARASERWGAVLDLGQLVNPAYGALNQLLGKNAFPTDLEVALPLKRETKLVATQPLFAPALLYQHQVRRDQVAAERAGWQAFARQLRADVETSYYQHGRAVALVALLEHTRALLEENLRVSALLVQSGKATPDTVDRARAELSELVQRRDEAETGRDAARRFLNFLANQDLEAPVPAPVAVPDALALTAAAAEAGAQGREELRGLAAGRGAAAHAAQLARSAYAPTLGLGAEYGFQGDRYDFSWDRDYFVVSLVLRFNLWNGFGDRATVAQADLVAARLATQDQELRRQFALQVRHAFAAADTARRGIATAADRVQSSRSSYAVVARRYGAGAAPQVELLEARTALTRAEVDEVFTRYEFAIRLVELERVAALAPEVAP